MSNLVHVYVHVSGFYILYNKHHAQFTEVLCSTCILDMYHQKNSGGGGITSVIRFKVQYKAQIWHNWRCHLMNMYMYMYMYLNNSTFWFNQHSTPFGLNTCTGICKKKIALPVHNLKISYYERNNLCITNTRFASLCSQTGNKCKYRSFFQSGYESQKKIEDIVIK